MEIFKNFFLLNLNIEKALLTLFMLLIIKKRINENIIIEENKIPRLEPVNNIQDSKTILEEI